MMPVKITSFVFSFLMIVFFNFSLIAQKKGSFSYPSVIQTKDGLVHISYSYRTGEDKKTIKVVTLNSKWIKGN